MKFLFTGAMKIKSSWPKRRNYPDAKLRERQRDGLENVKWAIRLWIDTAREFGDPIPEPKGRRLMYA